MEEDQEPSALRNIASGTGCGCGCLGMLAAFAGTLALVGIPLEVFTESQISLASNGGIISVVIGLGMLGLGVAVWVGSLFLD